MTLLFENAGAYGRHPWPALAPGNASHHGSTKSGAGRGQLSGLGIQIEFDAISAQPNLKPPGYPGGKLPAEVGCAQQKYIWIVFMYQIADYRVKQIDLITGKPWMIDLQDPVRAVGDILFGDVIHLVPQQNHHCEALSRISQPVGLRQYLQRQPVLEKIAMIS